MSRTERQDGARRALLSVLFALCLLGALALGVLAFLQRRPLAQAEAGYASLYDKAFGADTAVPDWLMLTAEYPGIAGWLSAPEIGINYPVMQGSDNSYYLDHLPDGSYNMAGSVFLDAGSDPALTDPLSALYGHHVGGGAMFSALLGYQKQAFYESHPVLTYYTPEQAYRVYIFAALRADADDTAALWGYAGADDEDAKAEWLDRLCARSDISGAIQPLPGERLLALVTCLSLHEGAPRYIIYGRIEEIE